MKNEENAMSEELDQLRLQYTELKARIERQEITNEKLIMESIRKDLRLVNSKTWISCMAGIMAILTVPMVSFRFGLRTPFIIISIVWLICMVTGNIIRNRNISPDLLSGESTQKFLEAIKKRKKVQFRWIQINLSLFVLWLGYFIGECIHSGMDRETLIPIIAGALTGAVIGLAAGLRIHNRIIGAYEGIIIELEHPKNAHDSVS